MNTDTRQMFETEEGSFIYFKDEERLFRIETDTYTKLLLKITVWLDRQNED